MRREDLLAPYGQLYPRCRRTVSSYHNLVPLIIALILLVFHFA